MVKPQFELDASWFVFNPDRDVMEQSKLNLVMAGSRDAVVMVEGGANFLPESTLAEAITGGTRNSSRCLICRKN